MAGETLGDVIRRLGRLSGLRGDLALTDAQLLERFARQRDESAFAALLVRHGPMVLAACRRLLHDSQEAEDAFQAAFLILARKAGAIRRQAFLGGWLYGVAYRVAARLRSQTGRRRQRLQPGIDLDGLAGEAASDTGVEAVIHEEVGRLPDKYRIAVILCYLEGKTNEEAALLLRRPVGTVKSRLTRARELLRIRLTRRGMALSGGALTAGLAVHPATAPAALLETTIRAAARFAAGDGAGELVSARAAALTQGVLRTMLLTKIQVAAALVLAVAVFGGIGSMTYRAWAEGASGAAKAVAAANPVQADKDKPKAAPADGPAPPTGAGDEKRQKLLQDWCDAAKTAFDLRKEQFLTGKVSVESVMGAAHRLLTAELKRSATKADRVAAYEAHLRRITDFTAIVMAKADAGRLAPADVADSEYFRLEAEILLEQEKATKDTDKPEAGGGQAATDKTGYAWGKAVKGLQAGLRLRPGEPDSYAVGETATFLVTVRNVSDGPLEFRYAAPIPVGDDVDQLVSPSVFDADSTRVPGSGPAFSGGQRGTATKALAAGEEIEFALPKLALAPAGTESRVTERPTMPVKPGKYKVSYNVYYMNPDDAMNYLTTGQVEMRIVEVRIKDSEK